MSKSSEVKRLRARVAELENELAHKRIEVGHMKQKAFEQEAKIELIRKIVGNSNLIVGGGGGGGLQVRMRTDSDGG